MSDFVEILIRPEDTWVLVSAYDSLVKVFQCDNKPYYSKGYELSEGHPPSRVIRIPSAIWEYHQGKVYPVGGMEMLVLVKDAEPAVLRKKPKVIKENTVKQEDRKYELKLHSIHQVDPVKASENLGDDDVAFYSGQEEYAYVSHALRIKAKHMGEDCGFPQVETNGLFVLGHISQRKEFLKFWKGVKAAQWPHKEYHTMSVENIKI